MSLLIRNYYANKAGETEEKMFFIRQKIKTRTNELVIEIEKNEININEEILRLKFFNKTFEYLSEIYLYKSLLTKTEAGKIQQHIIIKIENSEKKLEDLFRTIKRPVFFIVIFTYFGV